MKTSAKVYARANLILDIAKRMAVRIDAEMGSGFMIQNKVEGISLHNGYAEPGYESANELVATGNWNEIERYENGAKTNLMKRLGDLFERIGADIEWSDEWTACHECGKVVRTQPDSHWWKPSAHVGEGSIVCFECEPETEDERKRGTMTDHETQSIEVTGEDSDVLGLAQAVQKRFGVLPANWKACDTEDDMERLDASEEPRARYVDDSDAMAHAFNLGLVTYVRGFVDSKVDGTLREVA